MRIDGKSQRWRCQVRVHRPPYTQADRSACARWATHDINLGPYRYRCTQHTPRKLRVTRTEIPDVG